MASTKSGVVEVTWKYDKDFGNPCEIISELLRTPEIERIDYRRPEESLAPDVKIFMGEIRGCHHVFVQVTLKRGDFGAYASSLQARARGHASVSTAVWRRRQSLVAGGAARLGKVCYGAQALEQ